MRRGPDEGESRKPLDLRGLRCPLPVLRTRKALRRASPGARLVVLSDDPLAGTDIPNLVRETGDALLAADRTEGGWSFEIERGGAHTPVAGGNSEPA